MTDREGQTPRTPHCPTLLSVSAIARPRLHLHLHALKGQLKNMVRKGKVLCKCVPTLSSSSMSRPPGALAGMSTCAGLLCSLEPPRHSPLSHCSRTDTPGITDMSWTISGRRVLCLLNKFLRRNRRDRAQMDRTRPSPKGFRKRASGQGQPAKPTDHWSMGHRPAFRASAAGNAAWSSNHKHTYHLDFVSSPLRAL